MSESENERERDGEGDERVATLAGELFSLMAFLRWTLTQDILI